MKGRPIDWQPGELAWIEARRDWPRADLHRAFTAFWMRPEVTPAALKNLCQRMGWQTGRSGRFVKGNLPHTWRGAGHESLRSDGYVWIIVAETNPHTGAATRPVQKHKWLWEQANGPVPDGHCLKCLDGDRTNTDPANWHPIPRAMLPRLAGRGRTNYDSAPPELKPVLLTIARLEHAAREARKARSPQ